MRFNTPSHKPTIMSPATPFASSPICGQSLDYASDHFKPEKYSLRQRQKRHPLHSDTAVDDDSADERVKKPSSTRHTNKHHAKSSAEPARTKSSKKKPKTKAAPLSKYRRKTANARERTRMREINSAFENLRKFVPASLASETPASTNEKLTKITTLRLAMKYIQKLNDMLCHAGSDVFEEQSSCSAGSYNHFDIVDQTTSCSNDAETNNNHSNNNNSQKSTNNNNSYELNLNLDDTSKDLFNELLMTAYGTDKPKSGKYHLQPTGPSSAKTRTAQQKSSTPYSKDRYSRINNSKAMLSPCMSSPLDSPMDLGLLLESDGESLHLSEPCLSPMSKGVRSYSCSARSAMELGLLLDSDNDSLELSEPCLSPLTGLEALNPFSDLIHVGFAEHNNLDMYLT